MRRLFGLVRPYRWDLFLSIALAIAAQLAGLAIPWLTGRVVDDAIRQEDTQQLTVLIVLILLAGAARFGLMVVRRFVAGRMAVTVEYDLRNRLYDHLQTLSFSFYDRNQTGQLMSRATVDLSAVRVFLSYGLLFLSQHVITVLAVTTLLMFIDPVLALVGLAITPVLVGVATRYSRVSHPVLTDVQQRLGDRAASRGTPLDDRVDHVLNQLRHSQLRQRRDHQRGVGDRSATALLAEIAYRAP